MMPLMQTIPSGPAAYVPSVLAYLQRRLDAPLRLASLSAVAGVSTFHLQRSFRQITGHSPARRVLLLRLKRASIRLAFESARSITDIALEAGYQNTESFTRAFRRNLGQSPREFRRSPTWSAWRALFSFPSSTEQSPMYVEIVDFPETRVAAIEHLGSTVDVYDSTRKLVEWRRSNRVPLAGHDAYGVHPDLRTHAQTGYRVDICVSFGREIAPNPQGVVAKIIPGGRCARVRYVGSREYIPVVQPLFTEWLPQSGEQLRDFPIFFHYVNVGPDVADHEMITDVYLPLRG
jgi:AraC family transcriptional regulator